MKEYTLCARHVHSCGTSHGARDAVEYAAQQTVQTIEIRFLSNPPPSRSPRNLLDFLNPGKNVYSYSNRVLLKPTDIFRLVKTNIGLGRHIFHCNRKAVIVCSVHSQLFV